MKNSKILISLNKNKILVDQKCYEIFLNSVKAKTSNVYITKDKKFVFKKITFSRNKNGKFVKKNPFEFNLFEREVFILKFLNEKKCIWVPKLICYDIKNKIIMMSYCGVCLNKNNIPDNWELQINNILNNLSEYNIKHNDIKINQELLVYENKIYLCDWGWASINNSHCCGINLWNGKKPSGLKNDKSIINDIKNITK